MVIRSLKDSEQDACLDLWDVAFSGTPRSYFEKYFQDPARKFDDTVVCEESGRLVSAVHTVRRTVETRTGRKNMAGIANVGTHPEFRGRGFSTACLEETHRRLDADPFFDFGLLGTGIHDFYARLGWQRWSFSCQEAPNPFLGAQFFARHSRPATEADLPGIQRWHEESHRGQPIVVVRSDAYWRGWLGWSPDDHLVTQSGYAKVRHADGIPILVEWGGDFPLHEALGTTAERVRVCVPGVALENPTLLPIDGWMVRPVQGKPLPDLADGWFYDADGF